MKKILTILIFVTASLTAFTQPPQPNPNGGHNEGHHGNGHHGGGHHDGHGAPIGSGTLILLSFATAYGITKTIKAKKTLAKL